MILGRTSFLTVLFLVLTICLRSGLAINHSNVNLDPNGQESAGVPRSFAPNEAPKLPSGLEDLVKNSQGDSVLETLSGSEDLRKQIEDYEKALSEFEKNYPEEEHQDEGASSRTQRTKIEPLTKALEKYKQVEKDAGKLTEAYRAKMKGDTKAAITPEQEKILKAMISSDKSVSTHFKDASPQLQAWAFSELKNAESSDPKIAAQGARNFIQGAAAYHDKGMNQVAKGILEGQGDSPLDKSLKMAAKVELQLNENSQGLHQEALKDDALRAAINAKNEYQSVTTNTWQEAMIAIRDEKFVAGSNIKTKEDAENEIFRYASAENTAWAMDTLRNPNATPNQKETAKLFLGVVHKKTDNRIGTVVSDLGVNLDIEHSVDDERTFRDQDKTDVSGILVHTTFRDQTAKPQPKATPTDALTTGYIPKIADFVINYQTAGLADTSGLGPKETTGSRLLRMSAVGGVSTTIPTIQIPPIVLPLIVPFPTSTISVTSPKP